MRAGGLAWTMNEIKLGVRSNPPISPKQTLRRIANEMKLPKPHGFQLFPFAGVGSDFDIG